MDLVIQEAQHIALQRIDLAQVDAADLSPAAVHHTLLGLLGELARNDQARQEEMADMPCVIGRIRVEACGHRLGMRVLGSVSIMIMNIMGGGGRR